MRLMMRAWAVLVVAAKRLLAQRWLALATSLGLVMSVALALSIPLYADATYYRVLRREIWGTLDAEDSSDLPLVITFRYTGGRDTSVEWEQAKPLDDFLSQQAAKALRLPPHQFVSHFRTNNFGLYAADGDQEDANANPIAWVSLGTADDFEEVITLSEGSMPTTVSMAQDSPLEVLVSARMATISGLQVGDELVGLVRSREQQATRDVKIPIRVSGVWRVDESAEQYWFTDPDTLSDVLFISEMAFKERLAASVGDEIHTALWFMVMDGSDVHAGDVAGLESRLHNLEKQVAKILPGARLGISPMAGLRDYWQAYSLLTLLLYAFSIPIMGLILSFVTLVVGLAVGQQRNEIAVLRSRGATLPQVVAISALEAVILALVSVAVGVPVGQGITQLIGRARSFLDFSLQSSLRVDMTAPTLTFGFGIAGLALLAQVLPTMGAARHTVVTYKLERARTLRPPWWQRAWLDMLLLAPTIYGGYLLRQQGSIAMPSLEGSPTYDPFANPLLFLVPALAVFAVTLLILRIVPLIMRLLAWVAARFRSVGFLMAARHLSRTPSLYSAPLVLLTVTLSLSFFVATLAQTLDNHLYDQSYYASGADMRLIERGTQTTGHALEPSLSDSSTEDDQGLRWQIRPVSEHLAIPGVEAVARVGQYRAAADLGGEQQNGTLIAIDRVDFAQVAYWRDDFSPASLGAMLNSLATAPNGVLVSADVLATGYLDIGDTVHLNVNTFGQNTNMAFEIVGTSDLFPTWYPIDEDQGPLFVGNLDFIFQEAGGQFPYDVWLRTSPDASYEEIAEGVRSKGLDLINWHAPRLVIAREQRRPQRQGLFGVLSVGFIAAGLLAVLGFVLYAFFSFRQRFIELGVLRAIGLSTRQMTLFLGWELVFLMAIGTGAGTGLGIWISNLFIPYMQVGSEPMALTPPFIVQIPWSDVVYFYVLFGVLFIGALSILVALLMRMKVFQAVKLGETA